MAYLALLEAPSHSLSTSTITAIPPEALYFTAHQSMSDARFIDELMYPSLSLPELSFDNGRSKQFDAG
jgi:hypothetical protein